MNILQTQVVATGAGHAALWHDPHDLSQLSAKQIALWADVYEPPARPLPLFLDLSAAPHQFLAQRRALSGTGWLLDHLTDTGWDLTVAAAFFAHMGREAIHASKTREFHHAYRHHLCPACRQEPGSKHFGNQLDCKDESCGTTVPRLYRPEKLGDKQYIRITHPQYAAFVAVDVDQEGTPGGSINNINPKALKALNELTAHGYPPNLGGINPTNGKSQFIWFIDPVYSDDDETKPNRPRNFFKALRADLNELLGADKAFSHGFMRNPFYGGNEQGTYKWNAWHLDVFQMKDLRLEVNQLNPPATKTPTKTGTELIREAQERRKKAEAYAQLAQELSDIPVEQLEANDPNYVQGVLVKYNEDKTVARNQTAFEHALKTATRMRKRGEYLSNEAIIHAFTHAYSVALVEANDGRPSELPDQNALTKTAQRIRGYVTSNNKTPTTASGNSPATTHERKVLSTFGKRGGNTTAQRRAANPDRPDAKKVRDGWDRANKKRVYKGVATRGRVIEHVAKHLESTGQAPTLKEISDALEINERTVRRALKDSGIVLPRGRRPAQK